MILFTLLCLSLGYSFALPTPSNTPTDTLFTIFTRDADRFDDRSTLGLFWSCLSTIFICTWVAIHPNIPGPKDSKLVVLRRRMALMGYALLTPEIMIFWATRQFRAAAYLARRHKERGWTMAHGFFLSMGGFTLYDKQGTPLRILEYSELETLYEAGKIAWPSITEEEIQDKSKGDYLSKGIVIVQMGWFITQFIARCGYRLGITKLEVVTVGFTTLTMAAYPLWWHKPLDVRCSIPVYLLENANPVSEGIHSCPPAANPLSDLAYPDTSCEPVEDLESTPTQACVTSQFLISEESQLLQQPLIVSDLDPDPSLQGPNPSNAMEPPSRNNSAATSNADDVFEVQTSRSVASIHKKRGVLRFPVVALFTGLIDAVSSQTLDHIMPLCVPTFYSPNVNDTILDSFWAPAGGIGIFWASIGIFGLAQMTASYPERFSFHSNPEQIAWGISFSAITGCISLLILIRGYPVLVSTLRPAPELPRRRVFGGLERLGLAMTPTLIAIYLIARITFLILACIELRALSPTKLVGIKWTSFFPHIG
jgi:hypothetical protein